MKNSLKALVVVAILAIAGMASAQNGANANATANATVVCPVTISNTSGGNLQFGTITDGATGTALGTYPAYAAGTAGYMVVAPNSTTTYVRCANFTGSPAGASPHAADFTIGGQGAYSYSVVTTIPTNFSPTIAGPAWLQDITAQAGIQASSPAAQSGLTPLNHGVFPCEPDGNDGDPYEGIVSGGDDMSPCGCVTDHILVGGTIRMFPTASGPYTATINLAIAYN